MGRSLVIGAAMAILAGSVQASEPWEQGVRWKAAAAASAAARAAQETPAAHPDNFNATCGYSQAAFCYDAHGKRLVYRAGRSFMPAFQGLTAEGISVRHDRIVLRYTFK